MAPECTKQWYRDTLCLSSDGFLPSKGERHLYPKSECRERLGSPNSVGAYPWRHRGGVEYVQYVKELYERVHQKKLYPSDMLPWHFARGLLAQEDGMQVDWAEYAARNRRGAKRNAMMKPLKKYSNLRRPVPFTHVPPQPKNPTRESTPLVSYFCLLLTLHTMSVAKLPLLDFFSNDNVVFPLRGLF